MLCQIVVGTEFQNFINVAFSLVPALENLDCYPKMSKICS